MHMLHSLFYLTTAVHVSGVTITHLQEHKTTVTTACTGGRCIGLTTLPPLCVDCLEIWEPQPPETLWACLGL